MMIGILVVSIGVVIRWIAIRQLGSDFSLELRCPKQITTTGIYKYMRHGCYFGTLLIILGLSLIEEVLAIMALTIAFFLSRIASEEQILNHYPAYQEYKHKVGIFWPKRKCKNASH